jgi:hypothetical protein
MSEAGGGSRAARDRRAEARVELLEIVPLGLGLLAVAIATAFGWDARLLDAIVSPPPVVRIALAGASVVVAMLLLGGAVAHMEGRVGGGGHLVTMLRGIRLAFLALAALAVALGWALGNPLPFVVALIIAGIDVIETSFLLIVVRQGEKS